MASEKTIGVLDVLWSWLEIEEVSWGRRGADRVGSTPSYRDGRACGARKEPWRSGHGLLWFDPIFC